MRVPDWAATTGEWVKSMSPYQLGLRLLIIAGVIGIYASLETAPGQQTWMLYGLVPLTAFVVAFPDSEAALALLLLPALGWLIFNDASDRLAFPSLSLALSFLVVHVATAHAALGPQGAVFTATTARRWAVMTALVGLLTVLAWSLANYLTGRHQTGSAVVSGLAFAMVLLFVAYLVVEPRPANR